MRCLAVSALLAVAAPAVAQDRCAEITELNPVFFGFEQTDLSDELARERLAENLSFALDACPDLGVLLTGWADEDETSPDALSLVRAAAVAEWYQAQGVALARIGVYGRGEDPNSNAIEDPGPGDARARRVDSDPVLTADLPPDALNWRRRIAVRDDPAPLTVAVGNGVALTLDWALADGGAASDCPDLDGAPTELVLVAASLAVGGREVALDAACLGSAWPANALLGRAVAEVAPGVYVIDGALLVGSGEPVGTGWLVGPRGSRRTDGQVCARYDGLWTELDLGLLAIAQAHRDGQDTAGLHETLGATLDDLAPLLALVAEVGGPADGGRLDCAPLASSHDH